MVVISKTNYSIYDKNGQEVKILIKGNTYKARKSFHNGYIVFDEIGQEDYFINDRFKKMFTNAE